MIDRKFILYAILGIVLFALWNAWQVDYGKTKDNLSTNTPSFSQTQAHPQTETPNTITINKPKNGKIIKVSTDVLDVYINTAGGNIVKAELPKYPEELHGEKPIRILSDDPSDLYFIQSGLINKDSSIDKQVNYTSTKNNYTLSPGEKQLTVNLYSDDKNLFITKSFTFTKQKYDIAVNYNVKNQTNSEWQGKFYNQIVRKNTAPASGMFALNTYNGASISSPETPYEKISYSSMDKENLNRDIKGGWVGMQQRYFLSAVIPDKNKNYHYYSYKNTEDGSYTIGFNDNALAISPGEKMDIGTTFYVGPEISENLEPLANGLDHTVDYGWLWVISIVLLWIMKKIHLMVGNWGWSIVLLTVLIKLVFYKLSEKSCCSMARMKDLAPKIQALKERYGDDKQKLSQATMEIYKKEKVNPLGGCLPMLVQIPFFIALYYVLIGAVELRQAPFIFWIHDLSVKDPYYILPILMGIAAFIQQKLSPPASPDPAQAKMMMLMPVMFTIFFLSFPAGLVLYWMTNNCLQVLQQWHINKKLLNHKNHRKIKDKQ